MRTFVSWAAWWQLEPACVFTCRVEAKQTQVQEFLTVQAVYKQKESVKGPSSLAAIHQSFGYHVVSSIVTKHFQSEEVFAFGPVSFSFMQTL